MGRVAGWLLVGRGGALQGVCRLLAVKWVALAVVGWGLGLSVGWGQELVPPLEGALYLSGNFGELRGGHFHSGIDFKTQGTTGLPVRAVEKGFVSRIAVSPSGYGNALYVSHPDGTTSVYGHLERFAPRIRSLVRDSQYRRESFSVNLFLQARQLPVGRGEVIAWSGNSGSSGGPHLHFELRDTRTQRVFDPLTRFKGLIRDTRPPEIREAMVFPQPGQGVANGSALHQRLSLVRDKSGRQGLAKPLTAWGRIGLGVKAYDRMDGTTNVYGVREMILKVDGDTVFHSTMDRFSFDDTRYIHACIDWTEWAERRSFFVKLFAEPGNYWGANRVPGDGVLTIDRERVYPVEYVLKDVYGNRTSLRFEIQGKRTAVPPVEWQGVRLAFDRDQTFSSNGVTLHVPRKNLYADLDLQTLSIPWHTPFAPLYVVGERMPLHSYCALTLDIVNDSYRDPTKYGVVAYVEGRKSWLGGRYESGKMKVQVRELGHFSVEIDTVPPVIVPVNEAKWEAGRRIAFKISDDLSGIRSYRGTLGGRFVLFEYDAKTNLLYCVYDPERMKGGRQTLLVVITDGVGNRSEFRRSVRF